MADEPAEARDTARAGVTAHLEVADDSAGGASVADHARAPRRAPGARAGLLGVLHLRVRPRARRRAAQGALEPRADRRRPRVGRRREPPQPAAARRPGLRRASRRRHAGRRGGARPRRAARAWPTGARRPRSTRPSSTTTSCWASSSSSRRRERREFSEGDLRLVMGLADVAAVAIVNARLYDRLEVQAITDGLTGLYNHRFFYDRLNAEVTRSRRYGLQLSLLMLDLDDFKKFNDEFGHQAGDRVLAEVGRIMREQLRKDVDIPCRYGGEEFAVILPHTPSPGAETVGRRLTEFVTAIVGAGGKVDPAWLTGERVRRTIEGAPFPGREPDQTTHITVSVGVATYPDQAGDVEHAGRQRRQGALRRQAPRQEPGRALRLAGLAPRRRTARMPSSVPVGCRMTSKEERWATSASEHERARATRRHQHRHRLPARALRRARRRPASRRRPRRSSAGASTGTAAAQSDPLGNLWADVPAEGAPHVVVTGHNDQIGLIVTYVDEHGFVFFDKVGGVDPQLLPGRHLVIHGAEGTRRRRRRAQADPHHPQGRAGQGAGAARAVHGHRRRRRATRPSRCVRIGDAVTFEAPFLRARRRPLRLARLRQPGGRLRRLPRPRALRGRAGQGQAHRAGHRARGDDLHGRQGHGPAPRRRRDHRRRRRLRQRGPLGRPQEARRRGQARRAAR